MNSYLGESNLTKPGLSQLRAHNNGIICPPHPAQTASPKTTTKKKKKAKKTMTLLPPAMGSLADVFIRGNVRTVVGGQKLDIN